MKFKDIPLGLRAIKRVDLPLVNVPCSLLPDVPELALQRQKDAEAAASQGAPAVPGSVEVGLRVLTGDESLTIERLSRKMAEKNGAKSFDSSDAIFFMAQCLYTCAIACVDPDSHPKDPDPFFGLRPRKASIEELEEDLQVGIDSLLNSPHVGRDGILYLAEQQELWQDLCNPQALKIGAERMWDLVGEVATSVDDRPFSRLRPGMRLSFARFMAAMLWTSPTPKSPSGSDLPESSLNSLISEAVT